MPSKWSVRRLPRIAVDTAFLAAVTLMTIVSFALMAGLAWRRRFDGQAHKRLIVCPGVLMLGPGLAEPLATAGLERVLDGAAVERMERLGLAQRTGDSLRLTHRGRFVGGGVTAELLV